MFEKWIVGLSDLTKKKKEQPSSQNFHTAHQKLSLYPQESLIFYSLIYLLYIFLEKKNINIYIYFKNYTTKLWSKQYKRLNKIKMSVLHWSLLLYR